MSTMYYSSESSDSDIVLDKKSLDLSYLMLDSDSLTSYLRNSIREQCYSENASTIPKSSHEDSKLPSKEESTGIGADELTQEERTKLELKMESLSTEAVGSLLQKQHLHSQDEASA